MEFFNSAVNTLQTIVIGLGGGLCVWGGVNLLEGYGQDNPGAKSQGVKQLVAGGGYHNGQNVIHTGIGVDNNRNSLFAHGYFIVLSAF